ncbi:MAG: aldolase [Phycisphaerae bacterium]|nr:aldolase [Phycisphaerae bacterium]
MQMRPSKVLKKLRAGQLATCAKLNLADPRSAEIAAMCGFDCIWLDMEHVPSDWSIIENQIRAAKLYNVDTLVRVARGSYSDYLRPLEADATGIMVPHVMSLDDAKKVVWQTRFHPLGRRPLDGGNVDGAYCMIDLKEYIKTANEQRFVIVQIEDPEPLDELEEIAKLPGIDMLFFGPADFSQGIGTPGQWDNPLIDQTRRRIAEVANANGKFAMTPGAPDDIQKLVDMGYRFISSGADVVALWSYFKPIATALKDIKLP